MRSALFDDFGLKKAFIEEYGGFADQRIKKLEKGHIFIVDDRSSGDFGANKQLYSSFCPIFADVVSNDQVDVTLSGNVPSGPSVAKWIEHHNPTSRASILKFSVRRGQQEMIMELASAMEAIVRPGAPPYDVSSYKFVCPRTAASLERLKALLDRAWET